jgi:threonine/homoserine/homoserine lactone efflux protein
MPESQLLLSFAVAAILIELTPGPNMAYLAMLSVAHGRRAGLSAVAGIAAGLLGAGLAAALGLAALIDAVPAIYQALRWAGVVYLFWLAWEGWRGSETSAVETRSVGLGGGVYFRRGLVTNLLNPKAFLFYIAVLPRFVDPSQPVTPQTIVLSLVYVAIATAIHAGIAVLAGATQRLSVVTKHGSAIRRILAVALAGVAVWLAFATAR